MVVTPVTEAQLEVALGTIVVDGSRTQDGTSTGRRRQSRRPRAGSLAVLSQKELEVLERMADGRSNAAIADHLVVGAGAVEKHVASIFSKLGLRPSTRDHRRVLAVLVYLDER